MVQEEILMKKVLLLVEASVRADEWPGGALIAKKGKIIVKAENRVQRDDDPTAHAEVVALRRLGKKLRTENLSGYDLYTPAEPCPMCMTACIWAGISKIYYGISLQELSKHGDYQIKISSDYISKKSFRRIVVSGGIMKEACIRVYREIFSATD